MTNCRRNADQNHTCSAAQTCTRGRFYQHTSGGADVTRNHLWDSVTILGVVENMLVWHHRGEKCSPLWRPLQGLLTKIVRCLQSCLLQCTLQYLISQSRRDVPHKTISTPCHPDFFFSIHLFSTGELQGPQQLLWRAWHFQKDMSKLRVGYFANFASKFSTQTTKTKYSLSFLAFIFICFQVSF